MTSTQPPRELVAAQGQWPDCELLVLDRLGAVLDGDGTAMRTRGRDGPVTGRVDTESADPLPEYFIRIGEQAGRAGIGPNGITAYSTVEIEVGGPTRRAVKAMVTQVTELMLTLDRGGAHAGVLVDACYNAAADAPEPDRDEDDRRRSSLWTLETRRHRGSAVYL